MISTEKISTDKMSTETDKILTKKIRVIVKIHQKLGCFEYVTCMTLARKIKIGKLIFHPFQYIPHLSCEFEHF